MDQGVQLPEMHAGAMAYLASALNERPDLDWIYQTACEGLARVLAVEYTFIVLYEDSGESYLPVWLFTHGSSQSTQRISTFPAPPISQSILKIGIPVVIRSAAIVKYLIGLDLSTSEIPQVLMLATLYHEGSKIGILGAITSDPNRNFLPHEIMRAQTIADQVAGAIVHARLFLTARKQTLYLELINEITRIALSGGNLKELLDHLACRVVETLFADGCYISLWEAYRKTLVPFSATGPESASFLRGAAEPDRSNMWKAAILPDFSPNGNDICEVLVATTSQQEPRKLSKAIISLPLKTGERKLGLIRVVYTQPSSFVSTDDLPRWEEIASQITLAITNIQAIEQEKKHRQEAELLQQATIAITSSLDLQEVLNLILTRLEQVVPFDSAAICLIEENHLRIAALGGSAWHSRQVGEAIDKSAGLFSLLEKAHAPVFLADAQQHPNYEHWSQSGEVVIHGWMGVPLIADDNPIGYLLLNNRERDIYTPQSAGLTQAFASQAAVAIEKARLFEQVRNGRERLHALSKKLVEIQEAERRYISHELHDEIGQQLTGLQFMLEMGKGGSKTGRLGTLSEAQELVSGLMSQIRELSLNLHPSMIDDLGLLPALNAHFNRFQQKTGIQVQFNVQDLDCRFPDEVEVSAFRVVQESLTNAARYAGVKEVRVSVGADDTTLRIEVSDLGRGFDTQVLLDSSRAFGIAGMRERTELTGGKLRYVPGQGKAPELQHYFPSIKGWKGEKMTVRVMLVDDHPIVLQGLRRLLESKSEFLVVAEASDGLEVLGLTERYHPDVVILDLMMPGLNGLEVTRQLCQRIEGTRIIVFSMHKDDDYVIQALRNGAMGYVIKDTGPAELVKAIHQVMEGHRYLSPMISERIGEQLLNHPNEPLKDPYEQLTNRERTVLQLVAEGYTGQEIADLLSISRRTAEQHRASIIRKLGFQNQREIVRYAIRKGILLIDG